MNGLDPDTLDIIKGLFVILAPFIITFWRVRDNEVNQTR